MKTSELKPFDLDAAKRGEKVISATRSVGKLIYHTTEANSAYRVGILWESGYVTAYTEDGKPSTDADFPCVFMAPKPKIKREGWVNVSKQKDSEGLPWTSGIFDTKNIAISRSCGDAADTVYIEWEEEAP
jgi:hypothetical protein